MKLSAYRQKPQPQIMIIPMIDIIFFLLVFYMMSTLYMSEQRNLHVQLPQAQHAVVQKAEHTVITISENDEIYINEEKIGLDKLVNRLRQYPDIAQVKFTVNADKNARHGTVIQVLDKLQESGAGKVSFGTSAAGRL